MAVKNVTGYKEMRVFSGDVEVAEFIYDFSVSGGATTDTYAFFKAKEAMFVTKAYVQTITGVTSGGSATIEVGKSGDTAGLVAQSAKTTVDTANEMLAGAVTGGGYYLAADDVVYMTVGTAALTAGKLKLIVHLMKATA